VPWPSSASSSAATTPSFARSPTSNADTSKHSSPGPRPEPAEEATTRPERSASTCTLMPPSPCAPSWTTSPRGAGPTRHDDD
jgi:hypothetical protein